MSRSLYRDVVEVLQYRSGDVYHRCLGPTLRLAKLAGVLPLSDHGWSWRSVISLLATAATFLMAGLSAYWFVLSMTMFRATKVMFYGSAGVACVLLHSLARSWPSLARDWRDTEIATSHIGYPPDTITHCRIFTVVYIIAAVMVHLTSIIYALIHVAECSSEGMFHEFLRRWFPQVLGVFPYSPMIGVPALIVNTIATITFSYLDLLITNTAYCLAVMFKQFNKHILQATKQKLLRPDWGSLYRDYQTLRNLASEVDHHISRLVLLSFIINLYYICFQLYLSVMPSRSLVSKVYFCVSVFFLIFRTLAVCISAANVHDHPARTKYLLFSVPHSQYCVEIERFLFQLCNDVVAISGSRFFIVTRRTLVTMFGLTMTYEVIMFQINLIAEDEYDLRIEARRNMSLPVCQ